MPYPRNPEPTHPLVVRIPRSLYDEVRLEMIDPATGHARYGSWNRMMSELLREWLQTRRTRRANAEHAHDFAQGEP